MDDEAQNEDEREWRPGEGAGDEESLARGTTPGATGTTVDADMSADQAGADPEEPERKQPAWRPSGSTANEDTAADR